MHVNTDPIILDKLHAFGARRRRLILIRGFCEMVACLLAVMSLIALIDWLVLLPDTVRYAMSIAGYAIVLWFVYRTCVRLIMHSPDEKQLAVLLESVDERFHEDLLSAIELGQSDADYDSPVFRRLLQTDVAGRIKDLRVERVLPGGVVMRWAGFAIFAVAVCLGLVLFAPNLHFGQLLARAMFPMANIARVSGVQVTIVEPAPAEPTVPQAEPISIIVELEGPEVKEARIELRHPDGQRENNRMTREVGRRYATTVGVGRETLEYRIKAGDAVTKWYTINAKPRPYVTAFTKVVKLPEYAEREPTSTTDRSGDVTALIGSTVELIIEPDQPIKSGSLRFEFGGEERNVPLVPAKGGKLKATLGVGKSGLYRVELVAEDTGFTNEFSPQHEWIALPDTVPSVAITEPTETLTLPADQILSLRGSAEDDLGLARVEQWIKVNGKKPVLVPLVKKPGATYGVDKAWDLLDLKLRAGDTVMTRLVAVDLAGHRTESNPLTLSIAADGVDTESLAAVRREQKLAEALSRLSVVANAQRARAREAVTELKKADPGDPQGDLYAVNLTEALNALVVETDRADRTAEATLRKTRGGADIHDVANVRLALAEVRLRTDHLLGYHLSRSFGPDDRPARDKSLDLIVRNFDSAYSNTSNLYRSFDRTVGAHEIAAAIEQLHAIVAQQRQVNDPASLGVAAGEARVALLRRRQSVAGAQLEAVEKLLASSAERYSNKHEKRIEQYVKHLAHHRGELTNALEKADSDETVTRASARFADEVASVYRNLRPVHLDLDRDALKARQTAERTIGSPSHDLRELQASVDRMARLTKQLADRAERGETTGANVERERRDLQTAGDEALGYRLPLAADLLRARTRVVESRPDADARLAADYGTGVRALTLARDKFIADTDAAAIDKRVDTIQSAVHRLAAVGSVREYARANNMLNLHEQYEADRLTARTRQPRQWDFEHEGFQEIAKDLRSAGLNKDAAKLLHDLRNRPYAVAVRSEFEARRVKDDPTKPTVEDLTLVQRDLDEALRLLEEEASEARKSLAEVAPTLPEAMRQAASEANEAAQQAQELAEQDASDDPDRPTREDLARLGQEQAALNERTQDVLDALRQEANLKDTLDREQLAQARDADAAAAMIKEPAERADAAVADALDQPPRPDRAEKLAEAGEQQQELAEALEQAADHFEKIEKGEDITESRQALRDAERELGVSAKLDEQYEKAERLAELTEKDPATALEELEKELSKNRTMQRELDRIAEQINEDAGEQLADAAKQEQDVAEKLADAQKQADPKNEQLARKLEEIAKQAEQLADREVANAEKSAQQAKAEDAAKQNQQAAEQLERAAETAAPSDAEQAERIAEAAQQAAEQLERATEQIKESAQEAEQAAQAAEQATSDQRKQAQARAAEKQAQQAEAEAQQAQAKAAKAAEQAQQAAEAAQQAEQQAAEANADSPQQARAEKAAEQARQQAEQAAKEITEAAREAQQAARRAQEAAKLAEQASDSEPTDAIAEAAQEQAEQAQADARAAEQTAQAGDTESAAELNERAQQTSRELADAAEQLKQAAQAAEDAAKQATDGPQSAQDKAESAESAAEKAQQAAESAEKSAKSAKQASESAQEAASHQPDAAAKQQAEQAAQKAEQASQLAQKASDAAQSAEKNAEAAQQSAEAAKPGSPEAQQASQQANQAADQAKQASDLAKQAAEQAQQAAAQAESASQQAAKSAEQQSQQAAEQAAKAQQAAEAAQQSQPGSEQAKQAAQNAAEAQQEAQAAAQGAKESQQAAQQSGEQSQQASAASEQAKQQAEQAAQQASAAKQTGAQQQQAAKQSAQQSQQAAQRAEQLAQQAAQLAGQTEKAAEQQGSPLAEAAEAQGPISDQVEQAGDDIARAARHAERLGESEAAEALGEVAEGTQAAAQQAEKTGAELGEAGSAREASPAVADARDAIAEQAQALAEATGQQPATPGTPSGQSGESQSGESQSGESQSGESQSGESQSGESQSGESQSGEAQSGESQSGESQSGQSQSGQSQSGQSQSGQSQSGQSQSGESQSGESQSGESPLDNPETGKWLARALDAADQAANQSAGESQSGESQSGESQSGQSQSGESQSGESQSGESQSGESQSASSESSGQGQSGQSDQPGQAGGPSSSPPSAAAAAAQAALQQAAAAQAQSMSAARSQSASQSQGQGQPSNQPSNSPLSRSQSLISRGGASADAGAIDYEKLPDAKRVSDEDWGRLPPKLARDLLEAQRDGVSGEYRHMVETYFRTIAERARKDKQK